MRTHHGFGAAVAAVAMILGASIPAHAQGQGPLVLKPIESRFIIAPEVKITDVGGATGTIIGGYAGRETDNRLFLGGGAYWLVDSRDMTDLFYVGLIAGWKLTNSDWFHVGIRGLAGFGEATVYEAPPYYPNHPYPGGHHGGGYYYGAPMVGWRDAVFVAEPEIRLEFILTNAVRIAAGGGYRVTTGESWFGDRLRGATGSISVQFGLGK